MIEAAARTATGRTETRPCPVTIKYQVTPPNSKQSVILSATESKKAPRLDAWPAALATGPSRRSGNPEATIRTPPTNK